MHHGPARTIVLILVVALLTTTFGAAAEGRRSSESGLSGPTTTAAVLAERVHWCANLSNAPALAAATGDLDDPTAEDTEWIRLIDEAANRPLDRGATRRIGGEFATIDRWSQWDRVCAGAYDARN